MTPQPASPSDQTTGEVSVKSAPTTCTFPRRSIARSELNCEARTAARPIVPGNGVAPTVSHPVAPRSRTHEPLLPTAKPTVRSPAVSSDNTIPSTSTAGNSTADQSRRPVPPPGPVPPSSSPQPAKLPIAIASPMVTSLLPYIRVLRLKSAPGAVSVSCPSLTLNPDLPVWLLSAQARRPVPAPELSIPDRPQEARGLSCPKANIRRNILP
jgi:hypothetical protein